MWGRARRLRLLVGITFLSYLPAYLVIKTVLAHFPLPSASLSPAGSPVSSSVCLCIDVIVDLISCLSTVPCPHVCQEYSKISCQSLCCVLSTSSCLFILPSYLFTCLPLCLSACLPCLPSCLHLPAPSPAPVSTERKGVPQGCVLLPCPALAALRVFLPLPRFTTPCLYLTISRRITLNRCTSNLLNSLSVNVFILYSSLPLSKYQPHLRIRSSLTIITSPFSITM